MPKEADVVNALNSINPYDFEVEEDESPLLDDFFEEPIKWYDHVEDMIKLSKLFLFLMDGERVRADLIRL